MAVTAFQHGRKTKVYVDGWDVSPVLRTSSAPVSREEFDITTYADYIEKEFQPGDWDGTIDLGGFWLDKTPNQEYASILTNAGVIIIAPAGLAAVGAPARLAQVFSTKDETPSDNTDLIGQSLSLRAVDGIGRGKILKIRGVAGAGTANGPSVDYLTQTLRDWKFAAQLVSIDGGSLAVALQHSATGVGAWVTVTTLTLTAEHTAAYASGVGTLERYIRTLYTLTGGTAADFIVAASKI
jgi:hypothetical protein